MCYFAADCTAAYFGAYLDDAGAQTVFADGVPLMAPVDGSRLSPGGRALEVTDQVNGPAPLAVVRDWS